MKRFACILISFLLLTSATFANNNSWKTYLSYFTTRLVEESSSKVYVVAEGSLFSYDKEDNSIRQLDKSNYLNDTEIICINYNHTAKSLLIIYENANIDILSEDGVYNLPYLFQNTQLRNKEIYSVYLYNEYAYISTGFGIMVVNMNKKEIAETYNLSLQTTSCCILDNYLYASTENGVIYGSLNDNLLDSNVWQTYSLPSLTEEKEVSKVFVFKNRLFFLIDQTGIFYDRELTPLLNTNHIKGVKITNDKLIVLQNDTILIYSDIGAPTSLKGNIHDISSFKNDTYWVAEEEKGIKCIARNSSGSYETKTESIRLDGPRMNSPYKVVSTPSKLYLAAGGKTSGGIRFGNYGFIMVYDYNKWSYISQEDVYEKFKINPRDYLSIAVHPADENHLYVSSFGDGVVEIKDMEVINLYNKNNSTLETIIENNMGYHFIHGLSFDKDNNLWMTNSQIQEGIKILDKDGKWHSVYVEGLSGKYSLNDILITSSNYKWINVPHPQEQAGIAIIDALDNNTSFFFSTMTDQDDKLLTPSGYTSLAEDKDGYVWVGTTSGPVYFTQPDRVIYNETRCNRIKLTHEDHGELYYFLDNQLITCIKVDQGNRKWFGTEGNGVYVLNEDNQEVIHQFTTANSPLLSDHIYSIDINDQTGEVFIGTSKGLISYQGEAIAGKEDFSDVYAFPNPVRPEYDDRVTITGLMDNSNVKITDLNGNLIYQTKSIGGQATWNCRNRSGQRVSTGIYLVLMASQNGSESIVTKIAVIK